MTRLPLHHFVSINSDERKLNPPPSQRMTPDSSVGVDKGQNKASFMIAIAYSRQGLEREGDGEI
jgi:hypothetical protein